jgi:hypothetical protein
MIYCVHCLFRIRDVDLVWHVGRAYHTKCWQRLIARMKKESPVSTTTPGAVHTPSQ